MTCDDFEIAIEQRLHGALGPAEAAALDVHLAACARCRAFEATARGSEAAMRSAADEAVRGVDWGAVERALAGWRLRNRLLIGVLVSMGALSLLLALRTSADGPARHAPPVSLATLAVAAVAVAVRVRQGRRLGLAGRGEETLALLRRDLASRTRLLRVLLWLLPVYAAACAAGALLAGDGPRALFAGLAVSALALVPFVWFVKRPRLARERAELGSGER